MFDGNAVRKSVQRSLRRLHTDYLDAVCEQILSLVSSECVADEFLRPSRYRIRVPIDSWPDFTSQPSHPHLKTHITLPHNTNPLDQEMTMSSMVYAPCKPFSAKARSVELAYVVILCPKFCGYVSWQLLQILDHQISSNYMRTNRCSIQR